jgi:nucleoside-diphosphate-sugar epimerase
MRMAFDRARELCGWQPEVALADGLEREWKWLQDHQHRWIEMSY